MFKAVFTVLAPTCLCLLVATARAEKEDKDAIQGTWMAESMKAGGQDVPADEVKLIKFTFKQDQLLIQGNFHDDREESCRYKIDATKSPKHFEFKPPKEPDWVLGIYKLQDEKLEVCLRVHSKAERPTEFSTGKDGSLLLIRFKRKPKTP